MMNIVADLIKGNVDIDEKMIAVSMLASAKEAADMYLNSTLTSSTPDYLNSFLHIAAL